MKNKLIKFTGIFLSLFYSISLTSCNDENNSYKSINSFEKYRELRAEKLNKPSTVIHNNDGCDILYFPINVKYC